MKFQIVIPSINFSNELEYTLKKLENQSYKKFFVTIVLDKKNKIIPKYRFDLKVLVVGKKNMSYKRNLAVKRFKSDFVGFLDSDAYPHKYWLKNVIYFIKNKKFDVVGGPSIPFPNQKFSERISHLAKRSFFVTGNLNFRKYLAKDQYCDWLESCNFFISRKNYLKYKGMNEEKFISEDFNFFSKIYKINPDFKVFYSSKIYIHHKERNFFKFLIQRFSFGTAAFQLINFKKAFSRYQSLYPLMATVFFSILCFLSYKSVAILSATIFIFFLAQLMIIFEIFRYIKNFNTFVSVLILINFANLFFALGSLCSIFLNLNKNLIKNIYISSRSNK